VQKEYDFRKGVRGRHYKRLVQNFGKRRKGGSMQGIQFVTSDAGKKVAVQIDLKRHGALWEDFYDALVATSRKIETKERFEHFKDRLKRKGRLRG
jgi:hypothetical protein